MADLVEALLGGSLRALARLLTVIQNETPEARAALARLYPHSGRAYRVGITGAPGTGKSTLVNSLAKTYREAGRTVGILAVDPTSPFTGGAVLGDRLRMRDLAGDQGVFIRSMATRGSLGGLARATDDAICALDAAGFEIILIETVGTGQSEVDIARAAHTTLVVEAPGLGDEVQAIKAGILEIADILVVNKADRPDAQNTVRALQTMLDLGPAYRSNPWHHQSLSGILAPPPESEAESEAWQVPIVQTVAVDNWGTDALAEAIEMHHAYLGRSGKFRVWERQRLAAELSARLESALLERFVARLDTERLLALLDDLEKRRIDPQSAVETLLKEGDRC